MELKLHPELKEPLTLLCRDPNTTIMILSGSGRTVLDDVCQIYFAVALFVRSTSV